MISSLPSGRSRADSVLVFGLALAMGHLRGWGQPRVGVQPSARGAPLGTHRGTQRSRSSEISRGGVKVKLALFSADWNNIDASWDSAGSRDLSYDESKKS